jgi:hypothetical protein
VDGAERRRIEPVDPLPTVRPAGDDAGIEQR